MYTVLTIKTIHRAIHPHIPIILSTIFLSSYVKPLPFTVGSETISAGLDCSARVGPGRLPAATPAVSATPVTEASVTGLTAVTAVAVFPFGFPPCSPRVATVTKPGEIIMETAAGAAGPPAWKLPLALRREVGVGEGRGAPRPLLRPRPCLLLSLFLKKL